MAPILLPLDGSASAEQALPYVRTLATLLEAHIHLVRVLPEVRHDATFADVVVTGHTREEEVQVVARGRAEAYLEAHARQLRAAGHDVVCEVRIGPAADTINALIEQLRPQIVVMTSYVQGRGSRSKVDGVVSRIAHSAHAPVLVVPNRSEPKTEVEIRRILIPLDGSALAREALPLAIRLAISAKATLIPLTVVAPALVRDDEELLAQLPSLDEIMTSLRPRLLQELGPHIAELEQHQIPVTPRVVDGFAPQMIATEAETRGVDLIVMATHSYTGLRRWALGSISDKVLQVTRTPLLLVRP